MIVNGAMWGGVERTWNNSSWCAIAPLLYQLFSIDLAFSPPSRDIGDFGQRNDDNLGARTWHYRDIDCSKV